MSSCRWPVRIDLDGAQSPRGLGLLIVPPLVAERRRRRSSQRCRPPSRRECAQVADVDGGLRDRVSGLSSALKSRTLPTTGRRRIVERHGGRHVGDVARGEIGSDRFGVAKALPEPTLIAAPSAAVTVVWRW